MKVEAPEIRRCCFCIPLRYGLIAWGYIKLAFLLLLEIALITRLCYGRMRTPDVAILSCFVIVLLIDMSFNLLFLVGGHRKTAKLLHIYYIYSIVVLCIYAVFYAFMTGSELHMTVKYFVTSTEGHFFLVYLIEIKLFIAFFSFGVQMYFILLIRSEVNKLRNSSSYRFSNPTAEGVSEVENGTSDQRTGDKNGTVPNHGTDNQFLGIIDQCKNISIVTESRGYNKL